MREFRKGLSVVTCHGGTERLPLLEAALINLARCQGVNEVIVVEMGDAPLALDLARHWGSKYLFTRHAGPFERARALNIGTAVAACDLVMWTDNDLLLPHDLPREAAAEMRARQLDYFLPHSHVRYLSRADSAEVQQCRRAASDCMPLTVQRPPGGAGIVSHAFIVKYGGLCEEFCGWGGEDDAWLHKVQLLGKFGVTVSQERPIHHLFHDNSGGYAPQAARATNPRYAQNLELWNEVEALSEPKAFVARFPPPRICSSAWDAAKVVTLLTFAEAGAVSARNADLAAEWFLQRFGIRVRRLRPRLNESWFAALTAEEPDGLVLFGAGSASLFLGSQHGLAFRDIAIAVVDQPNVTCTELARLNLARNIVMPGPSRELGEGLPETSRVWTWIAEGNPVGDRDRTAVALTQALSVVLGSTRVARKIAQAESACIAAVEVE